uniref:MATH domain-containing protein n=1 Tax=Salix viminalis TaxID=40686 RepID=A0A6N2N798_SALVM
MKKKLTEEEKEAMEKVTVDTVREERHVAPAHYSMKINSFSVLSEMVDNSYESREFEASGYNWSPKGTWSDEKGTKRRRKRSHGLLVDTVREERHVAPAHYSMKIDSFSLLSEMVDNSYESREFEASGYKWILIELQPSLTLRFIYMKLVLYPNGDKSRNGDGYISLYLVMADTTGFPPGWEINAIFKFFVFDQLQDKYLMLDGGLRRFSAIKNKWGFPQMLSLSIFNNASNGYLIGDSCVFGVEVVRCLCGWLGSAELHIIDRIKNQSNNFIVNDTLIVEGVLNRLSVLKDFDGASLIRKED